jgi:hypothetical protein
MNLTLIIAIFALVVAIVTLIYNRQSSRESKRQADELKRQNDILKDNQRLEHIPELTKNSIQFNQNDKELTLDIINMGDNATLTRIDTNNSQLIQHSIVFPSILQKGESIDVYFHYSGAKEDIFRLNINMTLYLSDKFGNKYKAPMMISRESYTIGALELIESM